MSLSIGIVGLPNVGKSTLFNALTKKSVPAENYPFCTIDPSVGIVPVPDERLDRLSTFSNSKKTIPAVIEFVDIAGLVAGASKGEGLGNKFLSHIREVDAILHMVRVFPLKAEGGKEIMHVYGDIDPLRDIQVINLELALADFETVTKRRQNLGKDLKKGDKKAVVEDDVLARIENALEKGMLAASVELSKEEKEILASMHLLTAKPMLYSLNKRAGSENLDQSDPVKFKALTDFIIASGARYVVIDAGIENELKEIAREEQEMFRTELGADGGDGIDELIRQGYALLGLMTYFTTGEDETRAWTVAIGSTAPVAGMAIHTDFKDKFIRAEVVYWQDLLDAGSYGDARAKGKVRTEGKEYVVKDGDVIEFKI